jgi:nascent polypeptide-associated complex subunit alpha
MFPGMRGLDPKNMQRMMKQMGIKTEELNAKKVTFELENGKKLIIENPNVSAMTMQGKKTYTVIGEEKEEQAGIPHEDVEMVVQQTGATEEEVLKVLEENNGDIAEAILKLKKE